MIRASGPSGRRFTQVSYTLMLLDRVSPMARDWPSGESDHPAWAPCAPILKRQLLSALVARPVRSSQTAS